jgi:hypothetical protein
MQTIPHAAVAAKPSTRLAGRILSTLPVLFLLFDIVIKLIWAGIYLRDDRLRALVPLRKIDTMPYNPPRRALGP